MAAIKLCSRQCTTCAAVQTETTFDSSANGGKFVGSYEFDKDEEPVITCTTVNLIYMLQCDNCKCQYVGETAQQRMYRYRTSLNPEKN